MPAPQEAEPGKGGVDPIEQTMRTPCAPDDERSPPVDRWGPSGPAVVTEEAFSDQGLDDEVPTVPTVTTTIHKNRGHEVPDAHVSAWFEWGERAAWLEFGCGLDRTTAERQATADWVNRAGAGG